MIPKLCHFYWGGGPLSELQYLSIVSFKQHNPDYELNLWMPQSTDLIKPTWETIEMQTLYTGKDYLDKAKELCTVHLVDFEALGFGNHAHEVQRADFFRWYVLYEHGGIWSDLDILYVKPITPLADVGADVLLTYFEYPTTGFLMAKPRCEVLKNLSETAQDLFRRNMWFGYQGLGPALLHQRYPNIEALQSTYSTTLIGNVAMPVFYPFSPEQTDMQQMFFRTALALPQDTIGIHWYNGHPTAKKYQNGFEKFRKNKSVISKYVRKYSV